MKKKILLFYAILYLPLLLLILLVFSILYRSYFINNLDYAKIYCELKDYLDSEKGEINLKITNSELIINYNYKIKKGPYKPKKKVLKFAPSSGEIIIYVCGSSPVCSKIPFSDYKVFPKLLEDILNSNYRKKFKVYNFGIESFDSFDLKKLVKATFNIYKPDLVIYYQGHMDYESAYLTVIKRKFYFLRGGFFKYILGLIFLGKASKAPDSVKKLAEFGDWIIRSLIEPNLLNFMQKINLIKIPSAPFRRYNSLIQSCYEKNIKEIIALCKKSNIPIIFITPIANLKAKPFGIYKITQKFYSLGLKERNYYKKIEYLVKAKDSEIFTGDLRAKSELNDFLRNIDNSAENVFVLDLEKELLKKKFSFGYEYFYDIGHLKPNLHSLIAFYLYNFIKSKKIF